MSDGMTGIRWPFLAVAALVASPSQAQINTYCHNYAGSTDCATTGSLPPTAPAYNGAQAFSDGAASFAAAIRARRAAGQMQKARSQFADLIAAGQCDQAKDFAIRLGDMQAAQAVPSLCTPR